jgi:hypothetical protein
MPKHRLVLVASVLVALAREAACLAQDATHE